MVDTKPSCRLAVLLARESRKAIIFRHGPAKQTRLIAWDRETDTFEPGQWMKRTRVYDERSDISPDGEHLLLFLGKFRPPFGTYTVLSRPPYFTALALWPKGDTWGGGGIFLGPREIVLDHRADESDLSSGYELPKGFKVTAYPEAQALEERIRKRALRFNPWRPRDGVKDGRMKTAAGGFALVTTPSQSRVYGRDYALALGSRTVPIAGAHWADFDGNGDLVFTAAGALRRLPVGEIAEAFSTGDMAASGRLLADFADMTFEPILAPYSPAGLLDEPLQFSPRLDRVTKEDRRRRIARRRAQRAQAMKGPS